MCSRGEFEVLHMVLRGILKTSHSLQAALSQSNHPAMSYAVFLPPALTDTAEFPKNVFFFISVDCKQKCLQHLLPPHVVFP